MRNPRVVLASQSFWRKELLSWLGVEFEVVESGFDEGAVKVEDPVELVKVLAVGKAMMVAQGINEGVVLGADTVVVIRDEIENSDRVWGDLRILGKPDDLDHARDILSQLRGRKHKVYTGVAVVDAGSGEVSVDVDVTKVGFRNFSDEELEDYIATSESIGKAGGYMILGKAMGLIDSVEGSVTGVIGLPLQMVKEMLERFGVRVVGEVEVIVKRRILDEFEEKNPEARLDVVD